MSIDPQLSSRLRREADIARREHAATHHHLGVTMVDGRRYISVIFEGLRVDHRRFGGPALVSILLLLTEDYPLVPPLGVYLDRPYPIAGTTHFIQRGVHGAPDLRGKHWHWFCYAYGGFNARASGWRPAAQPEQGHNLATALTVARIELHRDG